MANNSEVKDLLDAGVHFGHLTRKWNPNMAPYIYMERNGSTFCQPGCNQCMGACPYGVDLAEIFRTRMYLLDYQDPVLARQEYEELTDNAKMCVGCTGTPCKNACPLPIPLHDWLKSTARALG